ncbi:MAG: hypothetical protein U5K69_27410 [Balneolaceae bacterium]|nr:hypothetical protein [Balneolaceae bacterium]
MWPPMMCGLRSTGCVTTCRREAEPPRIWKFDPNNFPIVIVGANSPIDPSSELTQVLEREITKRFEQINRRRLN